MNLPRTYEKLHCKGEGYRFSGYQDPLVHKDRYTLILLLLYKDLLIKKILFIVISRIVLLTAFRGYRMYNYKIKTSFFSPVVPKAPAKKTGFN